VAENIATFTPSIGAADPFRNQGGLVRVVRQLTEDEVDAEVGPMYEVRSIATGVIIDAFADELSGDWTL